MLDLELERVMKRELKRMVKRGLEKVVKSYNLKSILEDPLTIHSCTRARLEESLRNRNRSIFR